MTWYVVQIVGTDGVKMTRMVRADSPSIAESMVKVDIPEDKRDWIEEVNVWKYDEITDELADIHYFGTP